MVYNSTARHLLAGVVISPGLREEEGTVCRYLPRVGILRGLIFRCFMWGMNRKLLVRLTETDEKFSDFTGHSSIGVEVPILVRTE